MFSEMFSTTGILLLSINSTIGQPKQETKATFFVAKNGNDAWSGKLAEPNDERTDGPFATLVKTRNAIREMKEKDGIKEPVTVMVRDGKYYLEETLALGSEDSGTQDCPITYMAYPGEKPILSGGRKVTDWKPYKGKILQAELSGAQGGKIKSRQLFFNGKRQIRARWPKFDPENPLYGGWAFMEGPAKESSHISFKYKPGTFRHHWVKPKQAEVTVFPYVNWCNNIIPIESIDEEKRIITLQHSTRDPSDVAPWFWAEPFKPGNRFVVENVLEELAQPGEWCLDSEEGIVYFWPPEDLNERSEVVVPVLDCLVDLQKASHITISGFTFTETTGGDNYHRHGLDGYGAMYPVKGWKYCGESMHLKDTTYCAIVRNHFYAVGGNAIYLEGYNLRNQIHHNQFSYTGANGVCLVGTKKEHPMFNNVVDNHFHHCGVILRYIAAVTLGISDGNLIAHNVIHDMPHHAINLSSNGYGRNIVEYNDIRRTCLELHDNGAINSWMDELDASQSYILREGERTGHIIRYNFIADTRGCDVDEHGNITRGAVTWGIYLDDFTSNCLVYGNIIIRSGVGICVHSGKNNILENNIIAQCRIGVRYQNWAFYRPASWQMRGFNTGNHCRGNIFYTTSEADKAFLFSVHDYTERLIGESENNLFFNAATKYDLFDRDGKLSGNNELLSLEEWKKLGYDTNSLIADPLFVDPEHDDYRLSSESPALKLGFVPIDVTKIGIS